VYIVYSMTSSSDGPWMMQIYYSPRIPFTPTPSHCRVIIDIVHIMRTRRLRQCTSTEIYPLAVAAANLPWEWRYWTRMNTVRALEIKSYNKIWHTVCIIWYTCYIVRLMILNFFSPAIVTKNHGQNLTLLQRTHDDEEIDPP